MMSKYSVSSTTLMPTTFTVITSSTASLTEFHKNLDMLPARKKRMTAKGSVCPVAGFWAVKICVRVLSVGSSMKPKKRNTKKLIPNSLNSRSGLNRRSLGSVFIMIDSPPSPVRHSSSNRRG